MTDLETEIVSRSVKDGPYRQQCYSHCPDRDCKTYQPVDSEWISVSVSF